MTAEIGTMKTTEQIDALFTLGADPVRYLVVPRTLAGAVYAAVPDPLRYLIGIACGLFYNVVLMGVNGTVYLRNTLLYLQLWDVLSGLIKAAVFGMIIAIIGCWQGLKTEGGALGCRPGDDPDRGHREHRHPHRELLPEQGPALDAIGP